MGTEGESLSNQVAGELPDLSAVEGELRALYQRIAAICQALNLPGPPQWN